MVQVQVQIRVRMVVGVAAAEMALWEAVYKVFGCDRRCSGRGCTLLGMT